MCVGVCVCVQGTVCVLGRFNPVTVKLDCTVVNSHRATKLSLCVLSPSTGSLSHTHTHTVIFIACHLVNIRFFIDLRLSRCSMAAGEPLPNIDSHLCFKVSTTSWVERCRLHSYLTELLELRGSGLSRDSITFPF